MGYSIERHGVLISGASTGIGFATALHLANLGYPVWAGVRQDRDAEQISLMSQGRATPLMLDVTDETLIDVALTEIEQVAKSKLDGLSVVNNAGLAIPGPVECLPISAWRTQFEVNLFGAIALTQRALPLMRRLSYGRIVNVSSVSGRASAPFVGAYAASKFALEATSDALRMELSASGIKVILIEPGVIATPIWAKSAERVSGIAQAIPSSLLQHYEKPYQVLQEISETFNEKGLPAERVAHVIEKALRASRPKHRYVVGMDARLRMMGLALPTEWQDAMLGFLLKQRGLA